MSISLADVKKHRKANSAWIVIHNDVYDVTKFLNEHPGGADSLLDVAGRDGTQAFEDVGHSEDARRLMQKYKIGSLPAEESIIHVDTCCGCPLNAAHLYTCPRKTWRTYDGSPDYSPKRKGKSPATRHEPAVSTIVVPRERRRRGHPCEKSWWWLYVLLALGVAAGGAFAYKKYGSAA